MTILQSLRSAAAGDVIDWTGKPPIAGLKDIDRDVTIRGAQFVGGARIMACRGLKFEDFAGHQSGGMSSGSNVLSVEGCEDIQLTRGRVTAAGFNGRALLIARSKGVRATAMQVSGTERGVFIDASSDVVATDTAVGAIRSDGVNLSRSHRVTIDGLTLADVDIRATDAHPDVLQIINSPTTPGICSDIIIRSVRAKVRAQGICLFDHGLGGADRVTIEDVALLTSYHHAVNMENVRGLILRNIRVGALPGEKAKPWVRTPGCTDVVSENIITDWDGSEPVAVAAPRDTVAAIATGLRALLDRLEAL